MALQEPNVGSQATVIVINQRKPPGGGALFLSIIGFCGVTAIIGIILGFMARSDAKRNNLGTGRANAAIVIGFAWLAPLILVWGVSLFQSDSSPASSDSLTPVVAQSSAPAPTQTRPAPVVNSPTDQEKAISVLGKRNFKCDGPNGTLRLTQCKKGTVKVPIYGTQAKEIVNIELTTGSMSGYVMPTTAKALEKFGVESLGDDGSGTGAVLIGN